jgi:hypothetical protein
LRHHTLIADDLVESDAVAMAVFKLLEPHPEGWAGPLKTYWPR